MTNVGGGGEGLKADSVKVDGIRTTRMTTTNVGGGGVRQRRPSLTMTNVGGGGVRLKADSVKVDGIHTW